MKLTNEIVIEKAREAGFDLAGIAKAEDLREEISRLGEWLSRNYHAGMKYMERNTEKRKEVREILPDAESVISLALNYYKKEDYDYSPAAGKISRYAWGKDYHLIIRKMLERFETDLKKIDPDFISKSYVDTGPVMDKAWAVKAGLGWLGKNTNIINKKFGSWIFLSTVITNYKFDYARPMPDFCGSCRACIEACPTNAIIDEYILNASKCISYLTIENKGEIPEEFKGKFNQWLFGCDICQDVCPWNIRFSEVSGIPEFNPERKELSLDFILNMDEDQFLNLFKESPVKRTKLKGLKRNALFLKDSS